MLKPDLRRFTNYKSAVTGTTFSSRNIDFEEFIGFLDTEHILRLKGKDHWGSAGNESQHLVRNLIAEELFVRQHNMCDDEWEPYLEFARRLQPNDCILTFNYDTIVETALEREEVPFRLFPLRYSQVWSGGAEMDNTREEVIVLKLHGSIDWFDYTPVEETIKYLHREGITTRIRHPIFAEDNQFDPLPIVEGPRVPGDPLLKIYRTRDLGPYFDSGRFSSASYSPLILAPSPAKLFYATALKNYWYGMNQAGLLNFGLAIIGLSLPQHDEYIRQVLWEMVDNYQNGYQRTLGMSKAPLRFVGRPATRAEKNRLRKRFRFVDWKRAEVFWEGFSPETVHKLFA